MPKSLPVIDISAPVCCAPVAAGPMSDGDALAVALRLKALADPARVKIMSYLFSSPAGEQVSGQLAAALSLSDGTVSHHLAQLRKAGLVISDRRGMHVFHRYILKPCKRCVPCSTRTAAPDPGTIVVANTGVWLSAGDGKHLGCAIGWGAAGQRIS